MHISPFLSNSHFVCFDFPSIFYISLYFPSSPFIFFIRSLNSSMLPPHRHSTNVAFSWSQLQASIFFSVSLSISLPLSIYLSLSLSVSVFVSLSPSRTFPFLLPFFYLSLNIVPHPLLASLICPLFQFIRLENRYIELPLSIQYSLFLAFTFDRLI